MKLLTRNSKERLLCNVLETIGVPDSSIISKISDIKELESRSYNPESLNPGLSSLHDYLTVHKVFIHGYN